FSFHGWARFTRGPSGLPGDRRRFQRDPYPPGQSLRDALGVSRAPFAKLQEYKRRMGWTFPWASSFGSAFNPDFSVWHTEEQQREGGIEYNYEREGPWEGAGEGATTFAAMSGTDPATYVRERPGMSAFAREDGI